MNYISLSDVGTFYTMGFTKAWFIGLYGRLRTELLSTTHSQPQISPHRVLVVRWQRLKVVSNGPKIDTSDCSLIQHPTANRANSKAKVLIMYFFCMTAAILSRNPNRRPWLFWIICITTLQTSSTSSEAWNCRLTEHLCAKSTGTPVCGWWKLPKRLQGQWMSQKYLISFRYGWNRHCLYQCCFQIPVVSNVLLKSPAHIQILLNLNHLSRNIVFASKQEQRSRQRHARFCCSKCSCRHIHHQLTTLCSPVYVPLCPGYGVSLCMYHYSLGGASYRRHRALLSQTSLTSLCYQYYPPRRCCWYIHICKIVQLSGIIFRYSPSPPGQNDLPGEIHMIGPLDPGAVALHRHWLHVEKQNFFFSSSTGILWSSLLLWTPRSMYSVSTISSTSFLELYETACIAVYWRIYQDKKT